MNEKELRIPFNSPLNEVGTKLQTYGCRQNNPDIWGKNNHASDYSFVSKDGIWRKHILSM